jgi:hypothetical protein
VRKLVGRGVPREQIATIGDADSDAKKQALFEKVRQGVVRMLIGSTQKMGTGTNVQRRLVALHHLDAPWKPAEVEQREGRILRQGNENKEVAIYRYVTEGSFDGYMWQALETKAKFISQVMAGRNIGRRADDISSEALSYAEVKAIASGNPAVLTLAEADAELKRLSILQRSHADEQYIARKKVRDLPQMISELEERLANLMADQETATAHGNDPIIIGKRTPMRDEVIPTLRHALEALPSFVSETRRFPLGMYQGLWFGLVMHPYSSVEVFLQGKITRFETLSRENQGPRAVLNALDRTVGSYKSQCEATHRDLTVAQAQLRDYHSRTGAVFRHEQYLAKLTELRDQLKLALSKPDPATVDDHSLLEISEQIKALKSTHIVDGPAKRDETRTIAAAEPVTARIRRQREAALQNSALGLT